MTEKLPLEQVVLNIAAVHGWTASKSWDSSQQYTPLDLVRKGKKIRYFPFDVVVALESNLSLDGRHMAIDMDNGNRTITYREFMELITSAC